MRSITAVVLSLMIANLLVDMATCLIPGCNMIGVNCNSAIVKRTRQNGSWRRVENSCCIDEVAVLPDDTLIGIEQKTGVLEVYNKATRKWIRVDDVDGKKYRVRDIAVMPDGRIVGVTSDETMVVRENLDGEWESVADSKGVIAIAVYPDGRILGVSKKGTLKTRPGVQGKWSVMTRGGGALVEVNDLSIQPDGTVYGVGKKSKGVHVLGEENNWGPVLDNSDCVLSIASPGNLIVD